jgi:hypothetical protein
MDLTPSVAHREHSLNTNETLRFHSLSCRARLSHELMPSITTREHFTKYQREYHDFFGAFSPDPAA